MTREKEPGKWQKPSCEESGNAAPGARASEPAALRKQMPLRSVPAVISFSPQKLLMFAMFGMKHRPLCESDLLRARRPALLGRCGEMMPREL